MLEKLSSMPSAQAAAPLVKADHDHDAISIVQFNIYLALG